LHIRTLASRICRLPGRGPLWVLDITPPGLVCKQSGNPPRLPPEITRNALDLRFGGHIDLWGDLSMSGFQEDGSLHHWTTLRRHLKNSLLADSNRMILSSLLSALPSPNDPDRLGKFVAFRRDKRLLHPENLMEVKSDHPYWE
jgi:hypothetical protein